MGYHITNGEMKREIIEIRGIRNLKFHMLNFNKYGGGDDVRLNVENIERLEMEDL